MFKGKYDEEYLISELIRFNEENGRPPISKDLEAKNNSYPSRKTYSKYFGSVNNALRKAGFMIKDRPTITKEFLKDEFFRYIEEFDKVPSVQEMDLAKGYPGKYLYYDHFDSWNSAVKEFGFIPKNSHYSDEELKEAFFKFVDIHKRIPNLQEFNNSDFPSFWCYQNRFGSWNKAVEAYGFKPYEHKDIEELKKDIIQLCEAIYANENRKIITCEDIDKSENCSTVGTYHKNFRKHLNITLGEFIRSIGYDMPKAGLGMIYEFNDGEVTTSRYEYETSTYLRGLNLKYERNIKYRNFIYSYFGNKDCDYVMEVDNESIYIEVAGMLDYERNDNHSFINKNYEENLNEKINMLKENKLKYRIIYPSDFKTKSLEEIFSFLYT